MKRHQLVKVEAVSPGVVRLSYADGFAGDYDLSGFITRGPAFAPLKDARFFADVSVGEFGLSFGWNLDKNGEEIDFGAEAARAEIEAGLVKTMAATRAMKGPLAAE